MPKRNTTRSVQSFKGFSCTRMDYEFKTNVGKFNLAGVRKALRVSPEKRASYDISVSAVAATRDSRGVDFHVHFRLQVKREQVNILLGYVAGALRPQRGEKGPYAEGLMRWLGSFFAASEVQAHVTGVFSHSREKWRSLLPLPLRFPTREGRPGVEVRGMFLNVPSQPRGGADVWLTLSEDHIVTLVGTTRMVKFSSFKVYSELAWLSGVVRRFVEERAK